MNATTTNAIDMPSGASWPAHARHPGYRRMFAPDALTLGIFLPLRFYEGDMRVLAGQSRLVSDIDARGFAAAWVRDIPLYDPRFGDAGQLFDPATYGLPRRQDAAHFLGNRQRHLLAAPPDRPRQSRRHHRPTLRRPPRHGHRLR